ncbi:iron ABC transporter permease [Streptococcaceae bacterium ESL0687]|nr:iron ABC transporter permease [Streptococcaceae bacterium ESL0687]
MKAKYVAGSFLILGLFLIFSLLSLSFEMNHTLETLRGMIFDYNPQNQNHLILLGRIARILVGFLVGASLALAGFIMQVQYQNDLADPSLMGVSDGSALAIVMGMILFPQQPTLTRIIFSILGSLLSYLLISYLYKVLFSGKSRLNLPLIGIATSMLLSSLTSFLVSYFHIAQSVSSWYTSRLYRVSFFDVIYFLPVLLLALILVILFRRQIDLYAFGPDKARSLGMNRKLWDNFFSLLVVLLTGVSIAIVGRIAFVGLIIPHMVKLVTGQKYSQAVLFIPATGGIFLMACDYLSRYINYPFETPIGLVLALAGVPVFLYLIRRRTSYQ